MPTAQTYSLSISFLSESLHSYESTKSFTKVSSYFSASIYLSQKSRNSLSLYYTKLGSNMTTISSPSCPKANIKYDMQKYSLFSLVSFHKIIANVTNEQNLNTIAIGCQLKSDSKIEIKLKKPIILAPTSIGKQKQHFLQQTIIIII